VPGIGEDDKVILWGGGIYNWFDPLTLIRAIDKLRRRRPDVRLFFLGLKHPNPDVPEMRMSVQARDLSDQLGLTGKHVFFNEGWVSYEDRQNYLLEADIGVSCHLDHVETAYSFRTRILDYLWAGLPMVVTKGDSFGELVKREGLGIAVAPEDPDALADALEKVLYDEEFAAGAREDIRRVQERFRWENVLAPLAEYVRDPWPAPDRRLIERTSVVRLRLVKHYGPVHDVRSALHYLRSGGVRAMLHKVGERIAARMRKVEPADDSGEPPAYTGPTGTV
jgi:glycosyltransferase involved in cell wall biosynthesis